MITNEGKNQIKRYLAQFEPSIAQSIAFGIGTASETAADTSLQLEVVRNTINLVSYDFVGNRLIFRAPIPEDFIGTIYEVGLYTSDTDPNAGNYGSRNISTFDSASEDWVDPADGITPPTFASTGARVGVDALKHNPSASATMTDALRDLDLDFSGNSSADNFILGINIANANVSSVKISFLTDSNNYYSTTITTPVRSTGYKIISVAKASFTATGTPDWSNITEMQIATTAGSGGAAEAEYDALRIEENVSGNLDYILVARKVLATPEVSVSGMGQDLEFSLDISI